LYNHKVQRGSQTHVWPYENIRLNLYWFKECYIIVFQISRFLALHWLPFCWHSKHCA